MNHHKYASLCISCPGLLRAYLFRGDVHYKQPNLGKRWDFIICSQKHKANLKKTEI